MLFILRCRLVRKNVEEVSAFGVAMMAGLAVGLWRDLAQVKTLRKVDKVFSCKMNIETVQKNCRGWKQAVASVLTNK
jgi:glycerol kinase